MGTTKTRALRALLATLVCLVGAGHAREADGAPAPVIVARAGAGEPLTLNQCIDHAVTRNDAVQVEMQRRQELQGQLRQALATGLPTLDLAGIWNRGRDPSFALDSTFGGGGDPGGGTGTALDTLLAGFDFIPAPEDIPAQTYWRTSLDLNWTINPVRILGVVGAARAAIQQQELAITTARHQAQLEVINAYHGITLAAEQMVAIEARAANQKEFLEIMRLRHELELATALDTLQAAVALANLSPQLRQARRQLRTAGAGLNTAMGREPELPVAIQREQALERDLIDREGALQLVDERSELLRLDVLVSLLEQNRRAQTADMRPFLSVGGSYGRVGRSVTDLDKDGHGFWSASLVLNVPVFNGLLTRGQVHETRAAIRRTQIEREGLRRQVRLQVLDLLDGLEAARGNLQAAELNVRRADELVETSKLMLRHGQTDYLTVLESETERAEAQTHVIQARYEVLTTTAALKRAVGVSPMRRLAEVPGLTAEGAE